MPAPPREAPLSLKAQRAEATRDRLISTTITLLHERSYQGATVFEVAKLAGLTPGALQHHFDSKADLMMQAISAILLASGPAGMAWPSPDGPLAERCDALVQTIWKRCYEPPRFLAAWAVYFDSGGEPELRASVAPQRAALATALHERFAHVLPELKGRKEATALVDLVLSALRGLGVVRLFGAAPAQERQQLKMLAACLEGQCRSLSPATATARRQRAVGPRVATDRRP